MNNALLEANKDFWEPTDPPRNFTQWCSENVFKACMEQIASCNLWVDSDENSDLKLTFCSEYSYVDEGGMVDMMSKSFSLRDAAINALEDYGDYTGRISQEQKDEVEKKLIAWSAIDAAFRARANAMLALPAYDDETGCDA